ncbi:MAG: hypothetical protein CVT81_04775 [Alphaproteobacteria bacterium HGW-Alphaproteobacteria-3]|nr:MAG: hypothetical protein CVT81_04775 [Alphaproteobacteria bacterium HGW-Alphaproteobacteria-3]
MGPGLKGWECSFMDRGYPGIFLLMLGLTACAAAAAESPWAAEGQAKADIEACIAQAPESEGNAGRDCGDRFFMRCAEAGDWTTLAMLTCQGEVRDYWESVVAAREEAVIAKEDQRLTDWVAASGATYEAYREARCVRFRIPMGTMYGPMLVGCQSEMARERAEDLADFLGDEPLIVPEPE